MTVNVIKQSIICAFNQLLCATVSLQIYSYRFWVVVTIGRCRRCDYFVLLVVMKHRISLLYMLTV